jgi:mRNA-degrading endonuclease RelE of RelBE toxin-antitoxin system
VVEDRYRVVWEQPAAEALRGLSPELKATVLAALAFLETDPYLEWKPGGPGYSYAFDELEKRNFPVWVFKFADAKKWRAFYYVDERAKVVLVKELVPRRDDTFRRGTAHVERLIRNYLAWIKGRIE